MPNPYLISMEIITLALFVLCLWHAWRTGPEAILQLLAGVLFGVLLELATIRQLHAYTYGTFLLMVADVPLAIGVGWGIIIYSVRLFSDASSLPEWARPILDGLLALNIDLAMDAIAIRLGMWDWGQGFKAQYFGVPYANFWAWFWVVTSFSAGLRWLTPRAKGLVRWLSPFGALLIGMLSVLGTNALIVFVIPRQYYEATIILTLGGAILLILWLRPNFLVYPVDSPAFWVPFGFHAYFLTAGLLSGVILQPPMLLAVSIAMLLIALYMHKPKIKPTLKVVEKK